MMAERMMSTYRRDAGSSWRRTSMLHLPLGVVLDMTCEVNHHTTRAEGAGSGASK